MTRRVAARIGWGLVVALLVAVPALAWAESGTPLIDRPGELWLVPAGITVFGFLAGGAWAAWPLRRAGAALLVGSGVGLLGGLLLTAGDVVRRAAVGGGLPLAVAGLWLEGLAVTTAVAAVAGLATWWARSGE